MSRLGTVLATALLWTLVVWVALDHATGGEASATQAVESSHHRSHCAERYHRPHFRHYPALHRQFIPTGPSGLVVCRYRGIDANRPHSLAGSGELGRGRRLHRLVKLADRLEEPPAGPISCPADTGKQVVLRLGYRRLPDALVALQLDGCRFATNGPLTRSTQSAAGDRLVHLLRGLTETAVGEEGAVRSGA